MCLQKQKCHQHELLSLLGQPHTPKDQPENSKLMRMIFSMVGGTSYMIADAYFALKTRDKLVVLKKFAMNERYSCTTAYKTRLQGVISILKLF